MSTLLLQSPPSRVPNLPCGEKRLGPGHGKALHSAVRIPLQIARKLEGLAAPAAVYLVSLSIALYGVGAGEGFAFGWTLADHARSRTVSLWRTVQA